MALLRDGGAAFALKLAGAGLSYAMLLALSRATTPKEYGVFAIAFSLATLAGHAAALGQPLLILRWRTFLREAGEADLQPALLLRAYRVVVLGALVAGALAAVTAGPAFRWTPALAAGTAALILAFALAELQSHLLRADGRVVAALFPRDVAWRSAVTIAALATWAAGARIDAAGAILLCAGGLAAVLAVQGARPLAAALGAPHIRPGAERRSDWRRAASWYWVSSTTVAATPSLSVVAIGAVMGPEAAGPYFAAVKTAQLLNLVFLAGTLAVAPLVSQAQARGERAAIQRLAALVAAVSAGLGAGALLAIALAGDRLLELFGPGYAAAWPALVVLAAGLTAKAFFGPAGIVLQMTGRERDATLRIVAANALTVLALPVAVFAYGMIGAALCAAAGMALQSAWCWAVLSRRGHVDASVLGLRAGPGPARV